MSQDRTERIPWLVARVNGIMDPRHKVRPINSHDTHTQHEARDACRHLRSARYSIWAGSITGRITVIYACRVGCCMKRLRHPCWGPKPKKESTAALEQQARPRPRRRGGASAAACAGGPRLWAACAPSSGLQLALGRALGPGSCRFLCNLDNVVWSVVVLWRSFGSLLFWLWRACVVPRCSMMCICLCLLNTPKPHAAFGEIIRPLLRRAFQPLHSNVRIDLLVGSRPLQ